MPTLGRETLPAMLDHLKTEVLPTDEIILINDGPNPIAKAYENDPQIRYFELLDHAKGNPQRDFAIPLATGTHLMFCDDDDMYITGAIRDVIHPLLAQFPSTLNVFRTPGRGRFRVPLSHEHIALISGATVAVPNIPPLPPWKNPPDFPPCKCKTRDCEHFFLHQLLDMYPNYKFHDRCVYLGRPHTIWLITHIMECHKLTYDQAMIFFHVADTKGLDAANSYLDSRLLMLEEAGFKNEAHHDPQT